ncbi:MAG: DUF4070 domain-containing protein [Bacteroidales bacterium]|nr:DUF4070 domain-containing protein [Bacteroidales bacterium]
MNILLVYPEYPDTFWSFKHALKFVNRKAANPPLGLITVSSMLPGNWNKKLVDMNVSKLKEKHLKWADYVYISAMSVQKQSVLELIVRCKAMHKPTVAGGPLFTSYFEDFNEIDHLILNEAELTLDQFIHDVNAGIPKKIYQNANFPDLDETPLPDYSLLRIKKYASINIQFSRGCPFNCDFCDVTALFGHKVRTKPTHRILMELQAIYNTGWRGNILFVDDNFIGNKKRLKYDLLPAMIEWMKARKSPFSFTTEASINLADDPELMKLMAQAGFGNVFVGIETPEESCLSECNKTQNKNRDLIRSVNTIQQSGIEVTAGFIVGFDNDTSSIFQRQIDFIQNSGIITAMVGLLNAPKKTKLYQRLVKEDRIIHEMSGNNTDYSMNFLPKMDRDELLNGYRNIINGIYACKPYYKRVMHFLKEFDPVTANKTKVSFRDFMALLKSIFVLGAIDRSRKYYWRLFFWSLFKKPSIFPLAITYSIYGYHFRKTFGVFNI